MGCLVGRPGRSSRPAGHAADLDRLILWCQRIADFGDFPDGPDAYYRELLGVALMKRADISPQTRFADLDAAIECLETALVCAAPRGFSPGLADHERGSSVLASARRGRFPRTA